MLAKWYYYQEAEEFCIDKSPDKLFLENFADYYNSCNWDESFENFINKGFCNNNNNNIEEDYYALIDIADALYKIIRNTYTDQKIKSSLLMSGEKINDIERLILLYDKIDEMSYDASSDLSQLTYNTYKGTIPSWIWQSERADHYLQRIRFNDSK